jgi:antitoxin (DNA-binding transcriptional repressor) of toxin-antitoxin stability system
VTVRSQPVTAGASGRALDWNMTEPLSVHAEDQPSWAEVVRHAEHGESVSVIAHGDHVADIVPSGELDRLRETIQVLSDTELVRDLREGLADARAGRVFSADQIAADLPARRDAGECPKRRLIRFIRSPSRPLRADGWTSFPSLPRPPYTST